MELQIKAKLAPYTSYWIPLVACTSFVQHSEDSHLCSIANLAKQGLKSSNLMACKRYSVLGLDSVKSYNHS